MKTPHPPASWRALAAVVATAVMAACVDERAPGPVEPDRNEIASSETDSVAPPPDGDLYPGEQAFVARAEKIPSFAGEWYEHGVRVVALTDLGQEGVAREVLASEPAPEGSDHGEPFTGETRFVQARFDYRTLRGFRESSADAVLDVQGATFLDLDEVANRLVVGILDESSRVEVESRFRNAGVPVEATEVVVTGEFEEHNLQGFNRPLEGGLQLQNQNGRICTLGFITRNPANGAPAFVTASHCTNTFWGFDGSWFGQPAIGSWVGPEVRDPRPFRCGPFGWWRCRFSDAALVEATDQVAFNRIARTTFWAAGPGAFGSIMKINPSLIVTGVQNWPWRGQWVDNMGRTSGWTFGQVRRTCVTMPRGFWNRALCQYWGSYTSAGGDSGSPVFLWRGDYVTLTGVNWGGSRLLGVGFFSAAGGTRIDLGVP